MVWLLGARAAVGKVVCERRRLMPAERTGLLLVPPTLVPPTLLPILRVRACLCVSVRVGGSVVRVCV